MTDKELMDYRYDGNNAGVPEMNGYRVNQSSDKVSRILDSYLAKKNYNHIIIYSPIISYYLYTIIYIYYC